MYQNYFAGNNIMRLVLIFDEYDIRNQFCSMHTIK